MSSRYMIQKSKRWTGEEVFKILDKDMGRLSYGCYTTYEAAKEACAYKNSLDSTNSPNGSIMFDSDASAGQFTKRLLSLGKIVKRRNDGGLNT